MGEVVGLEPQAVVDAEEALGADGLDLREDVLFHRAAGGP